jgi:hypothetical protein
VVFGVIDPAVAASGDDQGVPYPMRTYARTRGVSDYLSQLSRIDDCPCCGWPIDTAGHEVYCCEENTSHPIPTGEVAP